MVRNESLIVQEEIDEGLDPKPTPK